MLTHPRSSAALSARIGRYLAGLVAIPTLVVALAPLASAQTGSGPAAPRPPRLTDAQRTCLAQHGVSLPTPGQRLAAPTTQQRDTFKAAAQTCGLPAPIGALHPIPLTDAQRTCLAQHGVQPPPKDPPSGPPTAQQLAAFRAAAQACGLPAPKDLPPPPS